MEHCDKKRKIILTTGVNSVQDLWITIFKFLPCTLELFSNYCLVQKAWTFDTFCSLLTDFAIPINKLIKMPLFCQQNRLSIDCMGDNDENRMIQKCMNVKNLVLDSAYRIDLTCFTKLETLRLCDCFRIRLPSHLKSLECEFKSKETDILFHSMSPLSSLTIMGWKDSKALEELQMFSNLTHLEFQDANFADSSLDLSPLVHCTQLKTLWLDDYSASITGLNHCTQIEKLSCDVSYVIISQISNMSNLTELTLENWKDKHQLGPLKSLTKLKKLYISPRKHRVCWATEGLTCEVIES